MKKIIKFIFLLFLYFSNISTAIFIYPIVYLIIGSNAEPINWYYFGIIFAIYEFGKFFGLFLWDFFSKKVSNIILILISLSFLCVLNLSYIFSYSFYHILLIRFLSGFFNNIGKFSKEISIQLGFKDKLQIIIFFISIICTFISIFLPSLISSRVIIKKEISNNNSINQIYQITKYLAANNLLSIIICLILYLKKIIEKKKTNGNFVQMNNLEKSDLSRNNQKINTKIPQSTTDFNRSRDLKQSKKNLNLKKKNKIIDNQNSGRINIKSYEGKKTSSQRKFVVKRTEEQSKFGKRSSFNLFTKKPNDETTGKEMVNQVLKVAYRVRYKSHNSDEIQSNKRIKYVFVHILLEISDTLCLMWILISLYIEYKGNCLNISIVYSCIRLIGEIFSFPINTIIIKNTSYYSLYQLNKISLNIMITNILLFFITIILNSSIFLYYYHFPNSKIMLFLLFLFALIRNIINIINMQLLKIVSVKCFNLHSSNMISLRKYRQYTGCFIKTCVFIIGSFGYYLIYNLALNDSQNNNFGKLSKIVFILYFIIFPSFINLILIITFKFFM